jgi:hypothetical protein
LFASTKITQLSKKVDNLIRIVQNKIKHVGTRALLCVAMSSKGQLGMIMHCYPVLSRGAVRMSAEYYIFQNDLPFNTHRFQKDPSSFTGPLNFSEIAQSV